jgi:hypothetical protein
LFSESQMWLRKCPLLGIIRAQSEYREFVGARVRPNAIDL